MFTFDLVIVGGGAAAFAAATRASELGARTAIINGGLPLGGTCVNVGCVPSKYLLELGHKLFYCPQSEFKGIKRRARFAFDFDEAIEGKDEIIGSLRESNYYDVLQGLNGVTLYEGKARFLSPDEIDVDGQMLQGRRFVIATGSTTRLIPVPGLAEAGYITNVEALSLNRPPASLIVIGAGPLGLEFAQMYRHFGSTVAVLERESQVLPREEPEVAAELQRCLEAEGISIMTGAVIQRVSRGAGPKVVEARVGQETRRVEAEELLMATGVAPNTRGLGLEHAGVTIDKNGFVKVDKTLRTSAKHIWAAGDVVGRMFLETVAAKEGSVAAGNALQGSRKTIDYNSIPHAVFTTPQVASVGLTEAELMRRLGRCSCRTVNISQVPKARVVGETRGLIKMVAHPDTEVIMGVHMVAPMAADLIHEAALAVKFKLTVDQIIDTVHVFPTLSEGIKLAAQSFKRDISRMSCCVE